MSDRTILGIVIAALAIVASALFAWITDASSAEAHLMFLAWFLIFKTKGPDA